ncbi:MAG TPA: hypothetical protein VNC18_15350 [Gemmatimonadaceae bacterium]|jgi:hypothetical protein|nr:hypothetical protein [Gemmatimonadaceae bacterium]
MTAPGGIIPSLQRPAFFPGERLVASDLAAVQLYHRELRWLHNRALHDWGVALGLTVTGNRGDKTVHINPGAAVDRGGREILLAQAVDLQLPAVAGTAAGDPMDFYITASYVEDGDLTPETRGGDCDTEGAVRLAERCRLRFQHTASFNGSDWVSGVDLVLASARIKDCKLASPVAADDRREIARGGPYVAAGATMDGATPWDIWKIGGTPVGVQTTVSTASAGFTNTPSYEARVEGATSVNVGGLFVVAGYPVVSNPTPSEFTFGVLLPQGTIAGADLNRKTAVYTNAFLNQLMNTLKWHVVWSGVEG